MMERRFTTEDFSYLLACATVLALIIFGAHVMAFVFYATDIFPTWFEGFEIDMDAELKEMVFWLAVACYTGAGYIWFNRN